MKIEIRSFGGTVPRVSPELLGDSNAQSAKNISIKSGKIHPEKKFTILYPDKDYVPGQINDDQYHRLYFVDGNGTLKVVGLFGENKPDRPTGGYRPITPNVQQGTEGGGSSSATSETLSVRVVDLPVVKTAPVLVSVSSPFLDAIDFNDMQRAAMVANYGSTSWKAEEGVATHIYGERTLEPINSWTVRNNIFERDYEYNPWSTRISYPEERS